MHHHPRPPPFTASPANSEQTNPTRTNNQRDRDYLHPSSPIQGSGSSEDFVNTRPDQQMATGAGTTHRLNQIIQNFHTKAALIILQSRVELASAISRKTGEPRVNKWFNIELDETEEYAEDIKLWKTCDLEHDRPPPLIIETYLTTDPLPQGQRLVILDDDQKRWDVYDGLEGQGTRGSSKRSGVAREVLLERWTIELGAQAAPRPSDMAAILPVVYKKSIVLFRALYTYANFLPAYKLIRKLGRGRSTMGIKIGYRIVSGEQIDSIARADNLRTPLTGTGEEVTTDYSFGSTESPAGPFSVSVKYRTNTDFRIDDSEELLSSKFMGRDQDMYGSPDPATRSSRTQAQQVGSLPNAYRRNMLEQPDLGQAYGSLSTFHQAGIDPAMSPISALREAQNMGRETPSPPTRPLPQQVQSILPRPPFPAARSSTTGRKSSFNFQPFKTPTLSQSPLASSPLGSSPRVSTLAVPTLGSLTEEISTSGPETRPATSNSASDLAKRQPAQRFTSSFGHRKNRPSVDRTSTKQDDDQTSSGKASASSSNPPGSGLVAHANGSDGSAESLHTDADNIDDFLKMLEGKRDLLSIQSASAVDAAARRTTAALNRFHKMRESNAALSESMTSSLLVSRSPNTRHLTSQGPVTFPSTSSSPGKAASPHTPHTPFAPSRLSAAFSHDDPEFQDDMESAQDETGSPEERPAAELHRYDDPNAIDIPLSPRRYVPGYKHSSSVQRQSNDTDIIAELYGVRSHSMGSKGRKESLDFHPGDHKKDNDTGPDEQEVTKPSAQGILAPKISIASHDGHTTDSGSMKSSRPTPYRPRYMRREAPNTSPGQGSLSSTGVAGSVGQGNESGGSASGSWGRTRTHNPSRLENRGDDDDDALDLPFAMDTSTFKR